MCLWMTGDLVWSFSQAAPNASLGHRSLLRHQAREALRRHTPAVLASKGRFGPEVVGWVVRLKAPFDRQQFPSAASAALNAVVRQELDELWTRLRVRKAQS